MAGKFLGRGEIADLARQLDRTRSVQKREGLAKHPTRAVVCGCPDPNCGGWHVVDTSRTILTEDDSQCSLAEHNKEKSKAKRYLKQQRNLAKSVTVE